MSKPRNISPKDFRDPLLRALGTLTECTPDEVVFHKRVYPLVCAEKGIQEDVWGRVSAKSTRLWTHQLVALAFKGLMEEELAWANSKGKWHLTEKGCEAARQVMQQDTTTAPTTDPTTGSETETVFIDLRLPPKEGVKEEDPLFYRLAKTNTPCFGHYSFQAKACSACALARECATEVRTRYAEVAEELQVKENEARARASRPPRQENPAWDRSKAMALKCKTETACRACNETIPLGDDCYWIEETGMFHKDCL